MAAWLNVALPKGRLGEKVYKMFAKAGFECPEVLDDTRKLIFENEQTKVRYFWVKPSDVAIYVERGAADLGVAGKDILLFQKQADRNSLRKHTEDRKGHNTCGYAVSSRTVRRARKERKKEIRLFSLTKKRRGYIIRL